MRITYSDYILQGNDVLENIKVLKAQGCRSVELLMDGACWDDEKGWERFVPDILREGVEVSLHPPSCDTNLTSEMKTLREASFRLYLDTIHLAGRLGARSVVIHPGFCYSPDFDKGRAKAAAREYLARFVEAAAPLGIRLLVENVGFGHASLYTMEEYSHLLDGFGPVAGYLIDIGHAHINHWDIPALIAGIRGRIYGFHIHDNDRSADKHLEIGNGTVAWEGIFQAMKTVPEDCDFILEYSPRVAVSKLAEGEKLLRERLEG